MAGWTINDLEPPFAGTVLSGSDPVSLASAVGIKIHIQRPDLSIINRAGIIDSDQVANKGKWSMPLVVGDLPVVGTNYKLEVEVEWTVGRMQTFGPITFPVTGEIA